MRERFADHLAQIERRIKAALTDAIATLALVAEAVLEPTTDSLQAITAAAVRLRSSSRDGDAALVTVSAREAPVAEDLRLVLTLIGLAQRQALIANQFALITEQLARIPPSVPDRPGTARRLAQMATLAGAQLQRAIDAFADRDLAAARRVECDDDAIDQLNVQVFNATLELEGPPATRARLPSRADRSES